MPQKMRGFYLLRLLITFSWCWSTVYSAIVPINQALTVVPANQRGGCTLAKQQALVGYWLEAYNLAMTGLNAYNNYNFDPVARDMFLTFFGINYDLNLDELGDPIASTPADLENLRDVQRWFQQVVNFMSGGSIQRAADGTNIGPANIKLFCNSNYATFQNPTNQAFRADGTPETDLNGNPLAIQQVAAYQQDLQPRVLDNAITGQVQLTNIFPYWIPGPNQYVFEQQWPGNPPSYCNGPFLGGTQDANIAGTNAPLLPYAVIICDAAFHDGLATFGSQTPLPGAPLDGFSTQSMTLLHELIHLVVSTGQSPDAVYGALGCISLSAAGGLNNPGSQQGHDVRNSPDCYAHFANGYALAQVNWNAGTNQPDLYYQFSTGIATQYTR